MRKYWFEILLFVKVLGIGLYAALSDAPNLSNRWFIRDDAYYYFKVAQNISEGRGSTFDGINRTNGYHPLWLWVNIPIFALARFDLILPLRILLVFMSALWAGAAILFYRLIGKVFHPAIGAIAAFFWVFSRDILFRVYQQGLESGIAIFFLLLFLYRLSEIERFQAAPLPRRSLIELGVLAVAVLFSRLDLVFLVFLAVFWIVLRRHPWRDLLFTDLVAISLSTLLAFIYRLGFKAYYQFSETALVMLLLSLAIKLPAAYLFGLYHTSLFARPRRFLLRLLLFGLSTSALLGVIMIGIAPLAGLRGFPRLTLLYDLGGTLFLFSLGRLIRLGTGTEPQVEEEGALSPFAEWKANWKTWIHEGVGYVHIVFGSLILYMLWNRLAFGTFSPVSGQIKRWWGSLGGRVYGGAAPDAWTFFGIDYTHEDGNAWHPLTTLIGRLSEAWPNSIPAGYLLTLALCALLFYLFLRVNKEIASKAIQSWSLPLLFCGAWLQVLSYHVTGYAAFKEWYWVSQLVFAVLVLSLGGGILASMLQRFRWGTFVLWAVALVVGFSMGNSFWGYVYRLMPHGKTPADTPYNEIAAFLEAHTEPGSLIGMTGGGNAGYFIHDRTVVNMDGLINSYEYFQHLKAGQAGDYLAKMGLDYVLANPNLLNELPYQGQYNPYLEPTDLRFGGKVLMRYRAFPAP
jgi:hypothetical protein